MKAVSNATLKTCFSAMHPSMHPDATCDVQTHKRSGNYSVFEPPAANSDAKEMMEAWHHL